MSNDPIVEEIHETRAKLYEESGRDLEKLMDDLAAREPEHAERVVRDRSELEERWMPLAS